MRYQQLVAASAMVAKRLSLILQDATNLDFQLSELNRLRDRVRRAEVQLDFVFRNPPAHSGPSNQTRTSGLPKVTQGLSKAWDFFLALSVRLT